MHHVTSPQRWRRHEREVRARGGEGDDWGSLGLEYRYSFFLSFLLYYTYTRFKGPNDGSLVISFRHNNGYFDDQHSRKAQTTVYAIVWDFRMCFFVCFFVCYCPFQVSWPRDFF